MSRTETAPQPVGGDTGRVQEHCLVCGSATVRAFVKISAVPVHSNVLARSRSQAVRAPKGDLDMWCCRECGHVFNAAFEAEETTYRADYENSLFCSGTFRAYADSLAAELIERFDLHGKRVVEIGCGSGDFLKLLCEKGGNDGVGFDPSALAGRAIERHPRISFVRDYYSAAHARGAADFLCCRQVLEHIPAPLNFVRGIREALSAAPQTVLFVEVPDLMFILREHSSWDLIYEHCSYFSLSSLHRLLRLSGFDVRGIWQTFSGQFICACAEPERAEAREQRQAPPAGAEDVWRCAEAFAGVFQGQVRFWEQRLRSMKESETRVVVWGAGSKGVTFLNVLAGSGSIEYVVDINEQKRGKFIPGTGQEIVSPGFLKDYRPGAVVLMNPVYETEVRETLGEMGLGTEILVVNQTA